MANNNKIIAEDTLKILNEGFYLNEDHKRIEIKDVVNKAVVNTKLYTPEESERLLHEANLIKKFNTAYEVYNESTLDAARRVSKVSKKILCLNFASAKNPGGGFLGGAVAQEESIARASALYPCLLNATEYYAYHKYIGHAFILII
jgi:uncharacterized protein (TIGR02452 family)